MGLHDAQRQSSIREALKAQGIDPLGSRPAEFAEFIGNDIQKWKDLMAATGLKE